MCTANILRGWLTLAEDVTSLCVKELFADIGYAHTDLDWCIRSVILSQNKRWLRRFLRSLVRSTTNITYIREKKAILVHEFVIF
jgi:hypothetical protein